MIVHQYEFVLSKDTFFGALHLFVNCCEAKSLWIELLCHSKYSNWLVKQNILKWFGAFKKWKALVPEILVMSYIDCTSPMNHLRCTWCKVSACSNWGAAHCPSQSIEVFLDFLRMYLVQLQSTRWSWSSSECLDILFCGTENSEKKCFSIVGTNSEPFDSLGVTSI